MSGNPRVDAMDTMLHGQSTACCADVTQCRGGWPTGPSRPRISWQLWPAQSGPGCPVRQPDRAATPDPTTIRASASVCRESGPGSLARCGRRLAALFVDWLIAYGWRRWLMAFGLVSSQAIAVAPRCWSIWLVLGVGRRCGCSGSRRASSRWGCGWRPVDDRMHVGIGRALVRGVLVALVDPAAVHRRRRARPAGPGDRTAVVRR